MRVDDDPRLSAAPPVRQSWMATLMRLGRLYQSADGLLERMREAAGAVIKSDTATDARKAEAEAALEAAVELRTRIAGLYGVISDHIGPATADQQSQMEYYPKVLAELESALSALEN